MSGHSHYSTIKRQKETKDAQKGKVFSRHARAIAIAIKAGGGNDPDANYKLRMAIEQAKSVNMPKSNIDRVLARADEQGDLAEVTYEGFGPAGVCVIVEAATDNRNRTAQEIKNLFEKGGGNMAGPGSVAFNFVPKGQILLKNEADVSSQILKIIDMGVEDVEETDDGVEVYVSPVDTAKFADLFSKENFQVLSLNIIQKPINLITLNTLQDASKVLNFLEKLEDQEDVQNVFANLDIPADTLAKLEN